MGNSGFCPNNTELCILLLHHQAWRTRRPLPARFIFMRLLLLRDDLQKLARMRLREARRLLLAGEFCGSYHLAGIAVECAIKACIAKQTQQFEFPDKGHVSDCHTHDADKLIKLAGLKILVEREIGANPSFAKNWALVKDWKVESRYDHNISETLASGLYSAVASRKHGVLQWLRQHW
jgi:hypothetical protein